MRENLMSGSGWQGMKTRHGDGTEALSEEMESNGSATPKSRRHPFTYHPTGGSLCVFRHFSGFGFFLLSKRISNRPTAGNANR